MRERLAYCGLALLYSFVQADLWEGVREMGGCGAEEAEKRGECRARYFFFVFQELNSYLAQSNMSRIR